jgi:predicted phosphohydrolase
VRIIVTSDLHYNHLRSKPIADEIIDQINTAEADVLIVIGDTAAWDGDAFERCLSRISFKGPKLLTAGNHEFWTMGEDSYTNYRDLLPKRTRELGWHWLEDDPFILGDVAIVGSVGWYDYSFAQKELGIPSRFYASKVSPGAAERFTEFTSLFDRRDDIAPSAMEVIARWNDGRFVKLGRSDEAFLDELLIKLRSQLESLRAKHVIAAIHHLPFRELLPPPKRPQWDFAKAYLGSEKIGQFLLEFPNISHVYCGHSHFPAEAQVGHIHAIATGCGYRAKTLKTLDK